MSSIGQGSISIDDSTRIGENAQDTANEVAGNVNDINSDNKLTPSEKLKLKQEYDKDVELYNIDIEQLKSVDLPTVELETAMSNLTDFVTPLFKEMNRTSTVDRDALDSVFTAFATADKNASQAFVNMVQQVADGAKKAGSDAKEAGEKAQEAGEEAKASATQAKTDATQAKADAATAQQKAQSSIDQLNEATTKFDGEVANAKNSAQQALDNITVVDSKVAKLSTSTTAQFNTLNNGYQEVISTVNNINVGGRNYILNSDFYITSGWKNVLSSVEPNEYSGKKITVSVDIEINNLKTIADSGYTRVGYEASFHASDNSNVYAGVWKNLTKSDIGKSFKYRAINNTYDLTKKTITSINDGNGSLGSVYIQGITADSIKVGHPKLEIATKATDWSPAPEDLASQTQITTLNNLIDQKVSNDQYQSDKTQTADLIASKVSSNDFKSYQTQTAGLIDAKVSNSEYVSDKKQTADLIGSKVDNGDFSTYKTQTANTLQTLVGRSPSNIIKDGGFNSAVVGQIPSGWDFSGTAQIAANSDNTNGLVAAGHPVLQINSKTSGNSDIYYGDWFDVQSGDQFYAELKARWSSMSQKGQIALGVATKDATGKWIWTGAVTIGSPSNWAKYTGVLTIPNGAVKGRVWVGWQGSAAGNEAVYVTDLVVRPAYSTQSDITQAINNIHMGIKGADGLTSTFNMNNNTILLDANKIILSGNTSIQDGTIGTAKIANAAINTAQIADGAINNAKIANASIDDAKINSLNGNKLVENSIAANKINVDDLIANGINTKTLTSVNLNTSTLTTPQLDLGLNGTFTEDFDYTQPTSMFLPKKNKGTLTFNHGVLQSKGDMQTYTNGSWGGMNDNYVFQAGLDNSQWTEVAPGYIKFDLFKQNDTDVGQRTYIDPTGYYYTSRNGIASYLGNVLQTPQVQTSSVLTKYIGPTDGNSLLQIGSNGSHYGLQVGPYGGNEAVLSDFIYDSTTSGAPNVNITANGHLVRSTSASKYKYNIKNPDIETTLGDRLLNVHLATWNDKRAVDLYAEQLSTGEEREKTSIDKYYGLIAEQLRDAGLDMFINYGKNHEIEGIQYDRAWVPLLSVIRRLNDKVNEYELRISKLEEKINE